MFGQRRYLRKEASGLCSLGVSSAFSVEISFSLPASQPLSGCMLGGHSAVSVFRELRVSGEELDVASVLWSLLSPRLRSSWE